MTATLKNALTRYGQSLYYLLSNRREFERIAISGSVSVTYHNRDGKAVTLVCNCLDCSRGGLGLQSLQGIPADSELSLSAGGDRQRYLATVRYCERQARSFRIGVAFGSGLARRGVPSCALN